MAIIQLTQFNSRVPRHCRVNLRSFDTKGKLGRNSSLAELCPVISLEVVGICCYALCQLLIKAAAALS